MFQNELIKNPKISVIITYYNLKDYIKDCIMSVLAQTYQNFEIIIIDDCSDEEHTKVLNDFTDERIKIIHQKENKGQLCAFLKGLEASESEFICLLDADDILLPNHLKTLLHVLLTNNVALVSSSRGEINKKNEVISLNCPNNIIANFNDEINYKEIEDSYKLKETFEIKKVKSPFALWSWNPSSSSIFRKSALDILNLYPDKEYWKSGADKVIFSFLHLIGGSINISAVTFLYRTHNNNCFNESKNTGNKKYLNQKTINKLICWNKKIRFDAIKMFIRNKKELIKKYNKINYYKMFFKVVFCINLKVCAKIIKTFAHRVI